MERSRIGGPLSSIGTWKERNALFKLKLAMEEEFLLSRTFQLEGEKMPYSNSSLPFRGVSHVPRIPTSFILSTAKYNLAVIEPGSPLLRVRSSLPFKKNQRRYTSSTLSGGPWFIFMILTFFYCFAANNLKLTDTLFFLAPSWVLFGNIKESTYETKETRKHTYDSANCFSTGKRIDLASTTSMPMQQQNLVPSMKARNTNTL